MKKIKVVQIGTGHDHASATYDALNLLNDTYEILGICEESDENWEKALLLPEYKGAKRLSLADVLNNKEIDCVFIETEDKKLVKTAQLFADNGFNVHMDKPGGENYEDFEKLVNTLKDKNLAFQMGYMYRYNEAIMKCHEEVKNGKLGDIISVETQMSVRHPAEKREWLSQFQGGMMMFLGCHLVDIVYMMAGKPEKVIPYNTMTKTDGVESEDFGFAVFQYKNGVSFVKTNATEVNGFVRRQIVVTGTKGTIEIYPIEEYNSDGLIETTMKTTYHSETINPWREHGEKFVTTPFNRYTAMLSDYAKILRGEKKNPFSYEYELEVQKLLLKACGIKGVE